MEKIVEKILEKEKILFDSVEKATSGFTNEVYFVGDKVLKIAKNDKSKMLLEKEILVYKNMKLDFIPKYISSGKVDDVIYLIISKLDGASLYSVWHKLSLDEKKKCVEQIAKILQEFEKQDANFLPPEFKFLNWKDFLKKKLKTICENFKKDSFNTDGLQNFIENDMNSIFEKNKFALVYNDAHFDNFIYNHGRLSLIDFDRVIFAPVDYEMMIFKTMCDNPKKFASEKDEDFVFDEDFENVYFWFKENNVEMFDNPFVEKRIKTYQFVYLAEQVFEIKNKNERLNLEKNLLNDFLKSIKS